MEWLLKVEMVEREKVPKWMLKGARMVIGLVKDHHLSCHCCPNAHQTSVTILYDRDYT